ncbi:MAG TPA: FAD-dependent oxidoreductase [Myxococcaceae bacterium]|jgi:2-polyprenyl-6-methoxyphenol hydroxylase-like FAD-dependent oxidoreductase
MSKSAVLITGAGPTGLVLAYWLARRGVRVRLIDKTAEAGTTSRAVAVQARTLELYRQLGLAAAVVEQGLQFKALNLWARGERVGHFEVGEIGRGLSPYPYILSFPQDLHERLLIDRLRAIGVEVERNTELLGYQDTGPAVRARIRRKDGQEEEIEADYLAGCDGARSTVRHGLGATFHGGTYERTFYVADAVMRGPAADQELHIALDDADFLAVFPMKGEGRVRLIGTVKRESEDQPDPTWEDISPIAIQRLRLTVDRVNWFSTYRVHHRVTDRFRRGRVFLAGDAAHIHSPAGGQGMNTGIGDAVNLAWKLAEVLGGSANESLLDTYEPERIAFARRLVATTDAAFSFATREGRIARAVRLGIAPRVVPRLFSRPRVRRFLFRTASQIRVRYRQSALSEGSAGAVHGGDRLPWVAGLDNFAPLASLGWQVHVYGGASPALADRCSARSLPLHRFEWGPGAEDAGLRRDALYLLRPDGYVALADPGASVTNLERYLENRGLAPRRG